MRKSALLLICLLAVACAQDQIVIYNPRPLNSTDPASTIKRVIEEQPKAYSYIPALVDVSDTSIRLFMVETMRDSSYVFGRLPNGQTTMWVAHGNARQEVVPTTIYFKNIGDLKLAKSDKYKVWHVEISDKAGNYLYLVYAFEESGAKDVRDAVDYIENMRRK